MSITGGYLVPVMSLPILCMWGLCVGLIGGGIVPGFSQDDVSSSSQGGGLLGHVLSFQPFYYHKKCRHASPTTMLTKRQQQPIVVLHA